MATKGSALVYERLSSVEAQIRNIDELLAHQVEEKVKSPSASDLQMFINRKLADLETLLARNPALAKQRIAKNVGKLVMGPMYPPHGPTYEVHGDLGLFTSNDDGDASSEAVESAGAILTPDPRPNPVAA